MTERTLRRSRVIAACTVVVAGTVALVVGVRGGSTTTRTVAEQRVCTISSLSVAVVGRGAALGHTGDTLVLRDVSAHGCTLTGYATVIASFSSPVATTTGPISIAGPGAAVVARHTRSGYLGGVTKSNGSATGFSLPIVSLSARTGVASATVEWAENPSGSATSCPTFTYLVVRLPGGLQEKQLRARGSICGGFQVHPFVHGTTGDLTVNH